MSLLASLKLLAIQKQALPALRVDPGIIQGSIMGPSGPSAIFALEDLEDQLRVYRVSALVYRCASIWAEETIQIPLRIFRWGPSGRLGPEVLDGPVWQLLDSINGLQAWPEFLYLTMLNLALTGNAFWWKVRNRRGVVVELWSLKPTEIKIERMPGSAELRYEWRPSDMGSVAYVFDQSSIVHLRIPSPLSDVWGMSPVRPAADDIRADQQAKRSTLGMLDNSALPAGVLVSSQDLSDEQAGMIRRQWREVYGGPANVGRIAVLGRGAEFKTIAVQPKDIEYLNQRKLSRAGIINAFGIPPIYVGIESENFGNRREQRRQLWQDKLVPLFRLIEGQITERLLRDFDASYVAVLDEMRTDIFVGIIGEQIETATKAVNGRLMTPNESRRTFLAPFLRDVQGDLDGGDEFLVPMSMVPASRVFSGETMDFFGSTQVPRTDPAVKAIAGAPALLGLTEGDAHRIEAWKRFESIELPATRGLWKALMTLFDGLAREIVSSLGLQDDAEPSEGMLERVVPAPGQVKALLSRVLDPHLRSAFQAGYKRGAGEIPGVVTKADDDLEDLLDQVVTLKIPALFDPLIGTFLQARLVAYGPLIAESIVTAFRASLLEGLQAGETITMLQNRLMAFSDLSSPMRALRVARTEIVNAANAGALASYRDSGVVEQQEWVTARDAFVRPAGRRGGPVFDHVAADGQVRAVDEPFLVSGESLMYPGDASMGASPGNYVNCRCSTLPIVTS